MVYDFMLHVTNVLPLYSNYTVEGQYLIYDFVLYAGQYLIYGLVLVLFCLST